MTYRRWTAVLVAIVGLVAVGLAQGVPNRHSIEDDLTRRSAAALRSAGLSDVEVSFTGRDGALRVPAADRDRALAIVRAVEGVRVATATSPPGRPASVTVELADGRAALTGTVRSDVDRDGLVAALDSVLGAGTVRDGLVVDATAGELRQGTVTLTGTVASQAARTAVLDAVVSAGDEPLTVVDRLRIVVPPGQLGAELAALPNITFESGSATLTAQGRGAVARAAAILHAHPGVRVRVEGHTDGNGTAARNLVLSQARAATVLTTLQSMGVAAGRLTAAGFGESRPKVPDTSPANQAVNRRVEFVVLP